MPPLENPRHEAFAQAIVEGITKGKTQADAYRAAGYKVTSQASAKSCASRLLTIANRVADRVRELQGKAARKKVRTLEGILERIDRASEIAEQDRQPSALVQAESTIAKLSGFSVERVEQGKPGDFTGVDSVEGIVEALLKAHGVADSAMTDDMRAQARIELERHSVALACIAQGDSVASGSH